MSRPAGASCDARARIAGAVMSESKASADGSIRFMSVSHHQRGGSSWLVSAWALSILSGAVATGLLRAPVGGPAIASAALITHTMVGVAVGSIVAWHVVRSRTKRAQLAAVLMAAAVAWGWWASRAFTPFAVAGHAVAAFAPLAIFVEPARAQTWKMRVARIGSVLLLLQLALAALVRHHIVGLPWHFLIGG